ncbi:Galactokinase OS=Streptomyces tendae OX=1932 GN=galK PE=3 SV=1 [Streptomyces tendae]
MGEAVAGTVGERFRELYGAEPEGVWAAPGRVNLIGEHTDYNDGFVMPFALPHQAVAAVSRREDGVLRLHSADIDADPVELRVADLAPGSDKSWTAYPSGVVWALREAGHELTGADVHLA